METEATMTNEQTQKSAFNNNIVMHDGLGKRLKATRESMRISEKDAAARLRLNPRIIPLMENEDFDNDLPPTFMRGYLRSYMRMLNIPEEEINTTVARIETTLPQAQTTNSPPILSTRPANQNYRYLRMMTYVVPVILGALVCSWWVSHPKDTMTLVKAITPVMKPTTPATTNTTTATPPPPAAVTSQPVVPVVPSTTVAAPKPIEAAPADPESDEPELSSAVQTTTVPEDASATPAAKAADAATSKTPVANATQPADPTLKPNAEGVTTPEVAATTATPPTNPDAASTPETSAPATTAEATPSTDENADSDANDEPKPKHHGHKNNVAEENNDNVYTDY